MQNYKLFVQLCESYLLTEASTLTSILQGEEGNRLLATLHQKKGLPHNAQYRSTDKLSWTDIKSNNAWIIFQGPKGYAGLKTLNNENYELISATKLNPETGDGGGSANESHGGRALEWIKSEIGPTRRMYISYTSTTKGVQNDRAQAKKATTTGGVSQNAASLTRKFTPLFKRIVTQTMADVRDMASRQLKTSNYVAVKKRVELLTKLDALMESLENGANNNTFQDQVLVAIRLAAVHAFPEEAGAVDISRDYYGKTKVSITNDTLVVNKFLSELAQGDTKKLSSVLSYFKQLLLHL